MVDCKMIELALADIGITRLIVCKIIRQSLFNVLFQTLSMETSCHPKQQKGIYKNDLFHDVSFYVEGQTYGKSVE